MEEAGLAITASGYPAAAYLLAYLTPDPERPARMSALIEGLP